MTPTARRNARARYARDPQKYRAQALKSYRRHRKKRLMAMKRWREINKQHVKAKRRQWGLANKVKTSEYRRRTRYGLSSMEYMVLLKKQGCRCKICKQYMLAPHVDHDHTTGKVRGLLCHSCNTFLGFAKDNPKILKMAIQYLFQ